MEKTQRNNIMLAFFTLLAVIVIVSIIGFFTLGKGPEIIQGQAEATEYRVSSKVPGRILKFFVSEGDKVKAGDTLAILEAPDVMAKLSQAQAAEQAAQALNEKALRGTRSEQLQAAYEMWQKAKAGLEIAEKSYNRVNRLYEEGVMTAQKRDEAKAQYDAMKATERAANAQYTMAKNGAQREDKAMAAAQVERAKGAVAEVSSYVSETYLVAAADGEVAEIFPKVGELVGTGAPIMNVAQLDDMWVTFNVREDFLKDFTVGSKIKAYVPALEKEAEFQVTVMKVLFRFDEITDSRRVFGAVVDRGYFSLANLARFVDAGSRVIVAAKTDSIWIQDAIETAMEHLWSNAARIPGEHCWGWTVPVHPGFEDGGNRKLWVHVYRSDSKSHTENTAFYDELESFQKEWLRWRPNHEGDSSETCPLLKSRWMKYFKPGIGIPGRTPLEQDNDAVDAATRYFGIFCNVTTMECSAREAMTTYRVRDLIEKSFKGGKTNIELDVVRAHGEATMEGRFIIGFAAMSILNRLYVLMKQKTYTETKSGLKEMPALADEMTFNELKNRLATPRVIFDRNGVGRWLEVTKRQHGIAARLGFPDLYTMIPDWAEK